MMSAETDYAGLLYRFFSQTDQVGLVSAYLFGSQSAGYSHRESDIDVGVLLAWQTHSTRRARFEERVRLSSNLISVLGAEDVDLVILNDAPPPLAASIVTTGRRIFCADRLLDRAFFRDVQLRAADLVPFLRRTRRLKLLALQR